MRVHPFFLIIGLAVAYFVAAKKGFTAKAIVMGALLGVIVTWLLQAITTFAVAKMLSKSLKNINAAQAELISDQICQKEKEIETLTAQADGINQLIYQQQIKELRSEVEQFKSVLAAANYSYNECKVVLNPVP